MGEKVRKRDSAVNLRSLFISGPFSVLTWILSFSRNLMNLGVNLATTIDWLLPGCVCVCVGGDGGGGVGVGRAGAGGGKQRIGCLLPSSPPADKDKDSHPVRVGF